MGVLVGHWKYLWKIVSRLPRKVEWMSEWRGRFIINVIRNGEEHLDEPVAYRTRRFSIYREPRMLLIPLTRRHLGGFECERHSDMKSRQLIARYRIFRVLEHNGKQSLTIFQRSRLKAREKYNACFWFLSLSLDDRFIDSPSPTTGVKGYHRYYQTTFPPFDKKSLLRNQFSDSGAFESLMAFDIFFFLFPFPFFFSPADFLLRRQAYYSSTGRSLFLWMLVKVFRSHAPRSLYLPLLAPIFIFHFVVTQRFRVSRTQGSCRFSTGRYLFRSFEPFKASWMESSLSRRRCVGHAYFEGDAAAS